MNATGGTPHQTESIVMASIEKVVDPARCKRVDVFADLDLEVDRIPFNLTADGDSATLIFNRISDALTLFRKFISDADNPADRIGRANTALTNLDLTIYLQNRHFGVIGSKANPGLMRVLSVFAKILSRRPR